MRRTFLFVLAVALAGYATQGLADDWRLSEKQAIGIGNGVLAANHFEPSRYRWHQRVWRYTDTRDWFIEFSPRYPGPGGNDVLVIVNDQSQKATLRVLPTRWSGGTRTVVPQFGGLQGPLGR